MEEGEVVEDAAPAVGRDGEELEEGEIEEGEIPEEEDTAPPPAGSSPASRRKPSRHDDRSSDDDEDEYWSDGSRRSRSWSRSPVRVSAARVRSKRRRSPRSQEPPRSQRQRAGWRQRSSAELREFFNELTDTESLLKGVPESSTAEPLVTACVTLDRCLGMLERLSANAEGMDSPEDVEEAQKALAELVRGLDKLFNRVRVVYLATNGESSEAITGRVQGIMARVAALGCWSAMQQQEVQVWKRAAPDLFTPPSKEESSQAPSKGHQGAPANGGTAGSASGSGEENNVTVWCRFCHCLLGGSHKWPTPWSIDDILAGKGDKATSLALYLPHLKGKKHKKNSQGGQEHGLVWRAWDGTLLSDSGDVLKPAPEVSRTGKRRDPRKEGREARKAARKAALREEKKMAKTGHGAGKEGPPSAAAEIGAPGPALVVPPPVEPQPPIPPAVSSHLPPPPHLQPPHQQLQQQPPPFQQQQQQQQPPFQQQPPPGMPMQHQQQVPPHLQQQQHLHLQGPPPPHMMQQQQQQQQLPGPPPHMQQQQQPPNQMQHPGPPPGPPRHMMDGPMQPLGPPGGGGMGMQHQSGPMGPPGGGGMIGGPPPGPPHLQQHSGPPPGPPGRMIGGPMKPMGPSGGGGMGMQQQGGPMGPPGGGMMGGGGPPMGPGPNHQLPHGPMGRQPQPMGNAPPGPPGMGPMGGHLRQQQGPSRPLHPGPPGMGPMGGPLRQQQQQQQRGPPPGPMQRAGPQAFDRMGMERGPPGGPPHHPQQGMRPGPPPPQPPGPRPMRQQQQQQQPPRGPPFPHGGPGHLPGPPPGPPQPPRMQRQDPNGAPQQQQQQMRRQHPPPPPPKQHLSGPGGQGPQGGSPGVPPPRGPVPPLAAVPPRHHTPSGSAGTKLQQPPPGQTQQQQQQQKQQGQGEAEPEQQQQQEEEMEGGDGQDEESEYPDVIDVPMSDDEQVVQDSDNDLYGHGANQQQQVEAPEKEDGQGSPTADFMYEDSSPQRPALDPESPEAGATGGGDDDGDEELYGSPSYEDIGGRHGNAGSTPPPRAFRSDARGAVEGKGIPGIEHHQQQQQHRKESEEGLTTPAAASSASFPAFLEPAMSNKSKELLMRLGGGEVQPLPRRIHSLIGGGRLALVLDLDHTLVNSVRFDEVDAQQAQALRAQAASASVPQEQRQVFQLDSVGMWTKLRPGARKFLSATASSFQLWIHTNGNRPYAEAIADLLDPSGALFSGRIIAQDADMNDTTSQVKSFAYGLEGLESVSLIVDDSLSVWPGHADNLFPVERYVWFPSSRRRLGLPGVSLMESGRDECPDRGMLAVAGEVLLRVHSSVFRCVDAQSEDELKTQVTTVSSAGDAPWDVRPALKGERSKVLAGCVIMFTRAIPLGQEPSSHRLWQLAERFGATCSKVADERVTHVVAGAPGTEKGLWAQRTGRLVVQPSWLEASCMLWMRAWEPDHAVQPGPVQT